MIALVGYTGWMKTDVSGKGFELPYHAEGMMGQLKIVDFKEEWEAARWSEGLQTRVSNQCCGD